MMNNLAITTIAGCPNNCVFCPQQLFTSNYYKISQQRLLTWDTFKKCIDKVPQNIGIDFSGFSEPFHNPLCAEMIVYAKKRNHRVRIYTTLISMKEKDVEIVLSTLSLGKAGKDYIYVHLPSEEKLDHIRVSDFYKIILNKLVEANLANIIFLQHGSCVNPSLADILLSKKVQYFPLNTRASTAPLFSKQKIVRKRGKISCSLKLRDRILLPNGDAAICCQDFGMKHVVGNLLTSKFSAMDKSKEIDFVKNGWIDESVDILCRNCEFAKNENAKAEIYNTPFYTGKILLILKVIVYNIFPSLYSIYKDVTQSEKKNNYLQW
jgi:organic radical activating enzyme